MGSSKSSRGTTATSKGEGRRSQSPSKTEISRGPRREPGVVGGRSIGTHGAGGGGLRVSSRTTKESRTVRGYRVKLQEDQNTHGAARVTGVLVCEAVYDPHGSRGGYTNEQEDYQEF